MVRALFLKGFFEPPTRPCSTVGQTCFFFPICAGCAVLRGTSFSARQEQRPDVDLKTTSSRSPAVFFNGAPGSLQPSPAMLGDQTCFCDPDKSNLALQALIQRVSLHCIVRWWLPPPEQV